MFVSFAFAAVLLAVTGWQSSIQANPKLIIINDGLKSLAIPDAGDFDPANGATFGGLTRMLPLYGWQVEVVPCDFHSDAIADCQVLMVINPTELFSAHQKDAIFAMVERGGNLLVLGDHTNIGGIMEPLNDLLAPTSIRFVFDSAIPFDADWKWKNCLRTSFHPAFSGRNNGQLGISVGASLACGDKAYVLVDGMRSYSDWGRPDYGTSRLGDMVYNVGEVKGGLPLVAEENWGKGTIQVWGDTAGFQDPSLVHTGRFHVGNLNLLLSRHTLDMPRGWTAGLAIIACLVIGPTMANHPMTIIPVIASVSLVVAISPYSDNNLTGSSAEKLAIWDDSHVAKFPNERTDTGLSAFSEIILKSGRILQRESNFERICELRPDSWILASPIHTYTDAEADAIEQYVRGGGKLFVFAGARDRSKVNGVLRKFGLEIANKILGAGHNSRLVSEWPHVVLDRSMQSTLSGASDEETDRDFVAYDAEIEFKESSLIVTDEQTQVLIETWDQPVAACQRVGQGKVYLIADSRFLLDENLEFEEQGQKLLKHANAKFLIKCLLDADG